MHKRKQFIKEFIQECKKAVPSWPKLIAMVLVGVLSAVGWLAEYVIGQKVAQAQKDAQAAREEAADCRKHLQNIEDWLLLHPGRSWQPPMQTSVPVAPNREQLLMLPQLPPLPGTLKDQLQAAGQRRQGQ